jgi:LPS-assembly protein
VGSDGSFVAATGSIDSGLVFERPVTVKQQAMKQTLEPRLFYVYAPFVDQNSFPVFDTSIPTFSFNSLFQDNRFIGADRVGDTHQLTMAVTTRLIDDQSGAERLTASLGQTYYFADRKVSSELPPLPVQTAGSSDIAGEVTAWLGSHWYLRSSLLFDTENNGIRKNSQFLQYQPAKDRILNIGYRFVDGVQELVDISGQWPITSKWAVLARSQYSIRDRKNQDSFAGLLYETCCWSFRTLAGQRVDQDGLQVNSFSFQLIFKGLAGFETGITSDMPLEQTVFD